MSQTILRLLTGVAFLGMLYSDHAFGQVAAAPAPAPAPTAPAAYPRATFNPPDYGNMAEGNPIDTRPPEIATAQPQFQGQTRAPYHKTIPYRAIEITGALHAPWAVGFLPDGKFLVTEKLPGALRVIDVAGNISPAVTGLEALGVTWPETGLFDLAFDPHFAQNHRIFFTFFAYDHGMVGGIQVARATFDEAANALRDVKVIFKAIPLTPNDGNPAIGSRSGGRIAIGRDGYLYITIGDRDINGPSTWRVAQNLDTDLGKIVRITTDGKPAPGNPFTGQPDARAEIWATGMRSQEGLAFDSAGQLWLTDDGPRGGDEINRIQKGGNYGWPIISYGIDYAGPPIGAGITAKEGMEQPAYYWSPSVAPSGMTFYYGGLFPAWKGDLFLGPLRGNALLRLTLANGKVVNEEPLLIDLHRRIRDVRVGPDGALYVLTDSGTGSILDNTPATAKLLKLVPQ
jgi:glucose/arabinose dehydrogenase